jgi:hypothetical protein
LGKERTLPALLIDIIAGRARSYLILSFPARVYSSMRVLILDGFVKIPISALRVSFVTAEYNKYASFLRIRKP